MAPPGGNPGRGRFPAAGPQCRGGPNASRSQRGSQGRGGGCSRGGARGGLGTVASTVASTCPVPEGAGPTAALLAEQLLESNSDADHPLLAQVQALSPTSPCSPGGGQGGQAPGRGARSKPTASSGIGGCVDSMRGGTEAAGIAAWAERVWVPGHGEQRPLSWYPSTCSPRLGQLSMQLPCSATVLGAIHMFHACCSLRKQILMSSTLPVNT